jgi:aspartyl-tRNA(Asn)/glutamyl-tRNA(Gln) amidotransferase subunit C
MTPLEDALTQTPQSEPPITREIFQHLVSLASLELDEVEAEYLRRELNQQLQAIRDLESIDLATDLPITSHGVPYSTETRPELRRDQAAPSDKADAILEQAPEVEERFIVVPDFPHTELE